MDTVYTVSLDRWTIVVCCQLMRPVIVLCFEPFSKVEYSCQPQPGVMTCSLQGPAGTAHWTVSYIADFISTEITNYEKSMTKLLCLTDLRAANFAICDVRALHARWPAISCNASIEFIQLSMAVAVDTCHTLAVCKYTQCNGP